MPATRADDCCRVSHNNASYNLAAPQAMLNYENMDLLMAHMNANAGTEGHTTGGVRGIR